MKYAIHAEKIKELCKQNASDDEIAAAVGIPVRLVKNIISAMRRMTDAGIPHRDSGRRGYKGTPEDAQKIKAMLDDGTAWREISRVLWGETVTESTGIGRIARIRRAFPDVFGVIPKPTKSPDKIYTEEQALRVAYWHRRQVPYSQMGQKLGWGVRPRGAVSRCRKLRALFPQAFRSPTQNASESA